MESETHIDTTEPVDAQSAGPAAGSNGVHDDLANQLAAERARADENHQKWLYAVAEMENYRKRTERQVLDRIVAGKKTTLLRFLPVLDNLERALGLEMDAPGVRGGLNATLKGFEALLSAEGVTPIDVLNAPFDPRRSEAVGTRMAGDVADDTVVDVVARGYAIGDDILRPAQVIVAKHAPE